MPKFHPYAAGRIGPIPGTLSKYAQLRYGNLPWEMNEELIIDMISDTLHFAAYTGHDPNAIIRMASFNYEAESEEEE